jgi:hypothetical protein
MTRPAVPGDSSDADRRNRLGLFLVGVVLAAGGGYGLARGWGAFGDGPASRPLLDDGLRRLVGRNLIGFWAAAGAVALLIAVIGLRWLRAQLATATPRRVDLTHPGDRGVTVVVPAGAADALAADVERFAGVTGASARLTGDRDAPHVELRVDVAGRCDVPTLRARIEDEALIRLRRALDLDELAASVEFRLTDAPPAAPVH